ncbi:hypothetical protein GCM10023336_17460 [Streptomyces similanensis]|uniref:Secreted protein n=1 Tax=Streptomyces similanensis TaxID=1274988 RepID=A0ABP9K4U1_9ACTN
MTTQAPDASYWITPPSATALAVVWSGACSLLPAVPLMSGIKTSSQGTLSGSFRGSRTGACQSLHEKYVMYLASGNGLP